MIKKLHFIITLALVALFSLGATAQEPVSGYYKVQNMGNQKYVSVKSKYYAKPDATVDNATIIYVGVGDSYKVGRYTKWKITSLQGDGIEVYDYLAKAIALAKRYVSTVLTDKGNNSLSEEEVELAYQLIDEYAADYGYLSLEATGNKDQAENDTWFLEVSIPDFNADERIVEAAIAHGITDGDVFAWAKRKVLEYLDAPNNTTDPTLKALVKAYLDKVEAGHTYFLNAEENDTFGYVDEEDLDDEPYTQWSMQGYTPEPGISGYFRVRNAQGVGEKAYVNVTKRFYARPNLTKDEAVTEPGTVIYVGMGDRLGNSSQEVTRLSGQDRNVNDLAARGIAKVRELALEYLDALVEENPDLASYKQDAVNLITTYEVSDHVYVMPTVTSGGDDAYYCTYTMPSLDRLADVVNTALSMGRGQGWASRHPDMFNWNGNTAVSLNREGFWAAAKVRLMQEIQNTEYPTLYPDLYAHLQSIINRVNPGVTYYLVQDADATFGYVDANGVAEKGDAAKWILEPVLNDGDYFAVNPTISGLDENKQTKYVTTLYTDFPYTLSEGMKAYKVTGAELDADKLNYIVTKEEVASPVPANTPVLLICDNTGAEANKLEPVDIFDAVTPGNGAPRRTLTEAANGNLLVADHFDVAETTKSYMALNAAQNGPAFVQVVTALDGNMPVLDFSTLEEARGYYIFPVNPELTGISSVNAKAVANVRYISITGMQATEAFDGVNIMVTTFTDGTQMITKIVK